MGQLNDQEGSNSEQSFEQVEFYFSIKKLGIAPDQQSHALTERRHFPMLSLRSGAWEIEDEKRFLSVLLNNSKRLSTQTSINYSVGLGWVLLSLSKPDACPLSYVSSKCGA